MKKGLMKERDMKRHERTVSTSIGRRLLIILVVAALLVLPAQARASSSSVADYSGLTSTQQATLLGIARDSWKFYSTDLDPNTHLPLDNITFAGGSSTPTGYGRYTSAANIGEYMWAVVAASDLGLITHAQAVAQLTPTLQELHNMERYRGFLYQWYDTTNGQTIHNPGQPSCSTETTPTFDNCYFISNVDNGLYASGLIVARNALPELDKQILSLMAPMNFGIFYDARPETQCNQNPAIPGNQPTGQMFGGVYVGLPVDQGLNWKHYYHNGALYSDPRMSAYIGMGLHQMPGNVWWRSWRTFPPKQCPTDPDFNGFQGQAQIPGVNGYWQVYKDPQSGQPFNVWEGHYTYPTDNSTFIPTYGGGMFEAEMDNQIVPETSWGTHSFGLADLRYAQVQLKYATQALKYPAWGLSCSSTADDLGGYGCFGAMGALFPLGQQLALCGTCNPETILSPYSSFISLDVLPQQAYANIQALRTLYPGVYGPHGFYDAVDPTSGAVGHRILVLDQSMIMASLDNALQNRALQRHFANDPISDAAHTYLSYETMNIQ
jgi:Putative glucoamylase/Protein of unknown function (DUF3131)